MEASTRNRLGPLVDVIPESWTVINPNFKDLPSGSLKSHRAHFEEARFPKIACGLKAMLVSLLKNISAEHRAGIPASVCNCVK